MASISDYTFQNMTRIGNDNCYVDQRSIQDVKNANYMLTNFYPSCPMSNAIAFATSQPSVFYSGSHQVGIGGCNIDYNSSLTIADLSKPKCKISLLQRPFATVPFLGRGESNSILESQIQQGDMVQNRKSINTTAEISYMPYTNYPLLPSIQATITNPANLVEGVAADGWIRGGLPSRDLSRDQDYFKKHGIRQY
jgi:hypothetical protein